MQMFPCRAEKCFHDLVRQLPGVMSKGSYESVEMNVCAHLLVAAPVSADASLCWCRLWKLYFRHSAQSSGHDDDVSSRVPSLLSASLGSLHLQGLKVGSFRVFSCQQASVNTR